MNSKDQKSLANATSVLWHLTLLCGDDELVTMSRGKDSGFYTFSVGNKEYRVYRYTLKMMHRLETKRYAYNIKLFWEGK